VASAKERLKRMGMKTAYGRKTGADSYEAWSVEAPPSYNYDLRE